MDRMYTQELKLYEVRSLSEVEKLREHWNRLLLWESGSTPYQTWEWKMEHRHRQICGRSCGRSSRGGRRFTWEGGWYCPFLNPADALPRYDRFRVHWKPAVGLSRSALPRGV